MTDPDDWAEPEPQYHDERRTCQHGIGLGGDCDWCGELAE